MRYKFTGISDKRITSIVGDEGLLFSCLNLIFDHEDGGNKFDRNVSVRDETHKASSNIELSSVSCKFVVPSELISINILCVLCDSRNFRHNCTLNIQAKELAKYRGNGLVRNQKKFPVAKWCIIHRESSRSAGIVG